MANVVYLGMNNNLFQNEPKWLSESEAAELLDVSVDTLKRNCRKGLYTYNVVKIINKKEYKVLFSSLPPQVQDKYLGIHVNNEFSNINYSDAPVWAKQQAEKYIAILKACEGLKGKALKEFVVSWNNKNHNFQTSYQSINKRRIRFQCEGVSGLLADYGKRAGLTVVDDGFFEYFKNLYLKEGAPSLYSCWEQTRGYAIRTFGIEKGDFPNRLSFGRRLENEVPKSSIYLARYGEAKWNRKYGNYIDRDYSDIKCGAVWVGDHSQVDVGCLMPDNKVVFPWVTVWRDFRSGKWLGWLLQTGSPNSDLIFQTFYYAASEFGLPTDVIIDNGKDYRCKDFAGGRKKIKIQADEVKTSCMLYELEVTPHFATPYNGQSKPVERDFLKIKELLSKHSVGYRGGNVVERPEILAKEIKDGNVLPFDRFKTIFDDFILNIFNKKPSQGKVLKGLSPDELFYKEFNEKRTVSKDALKLFCCRTSKVFSIVRNGIYDREFDIRYWADWMLGIIDTKVYLRRDIQNYDVAWVFKAVNDEFIGKCCAVKAIPALYAYKTSKAEYKEALNTKKQAKKIAQAYAKRTQDISLEEQALNYKAEYACHLNYSKIEPKVLKATNTNMDKAVRKSRQMDKIKKQEMDILKTVEPVKEKLFFFETDIEFQGASNGY